MAIREIGNWLRWRKDWMSRPIVIVLEDEPLCIAVFRKTLELAGYECAVAVTEQQALEHAGKLGFDVGAVIADLFLPTCRGTDVALKLAAIRPDLAFLFVSGTPLSAWPEADVRKLEQLPLGSFGFLEKPFRPHALLSKLEVLMGRHAFEQNA